VTTVNYTRVRVGGHGSGLIRHTGDRPTPASWPCRGSAAPVAPSLTCVWFESIATPPLAPRSATNQKFDRDEHQNGRPLAYQGVAFEDPSPVPSLQENPRLQSERSVCGGGDLGRTYQRRLSCKLGLVNNDGRVEATEVKRVAERHEAHSFRCRDRSIHKFRRSSDGAQKAASSPAGPMINQFLRLRPFPA
jgi:hypothetical protein